MRFAAAVSAVLHGVVLASLLLSWGAASVPQTVPPLEVELVQSQAMIQGAAQARPTPPTPPPSDDAGPAEPKPPPPPVHIGNGLDQSDPLTVTGQNVVPPAPDSRYRNQPPPYPADAARAGVEGTVQLVVHVSPQGFALEVQILRSSGNESLDGAARQAVQRWRFRPALVSGRAVAFDYPINIHFALGDHP